MSVIVAYSAAATGSPLNKAKPPKHSLNETGKFIILRLTVSPKIFPHCLYTGNNVVTAMSSWRCNENTVDRRFLVIEREITIRAVGRRSYVSNYTNKYFFVKA